jgi:hypothetical protein
VYMCTFIALHFYSDNRTRDIGQESRKMLCYIPQESSASERNIFIFPALLT